MHNTTHVMDTSICYNIALCYTILCLVELHSNELEATLSVIVYHREDPKNYTQCWVLQLTM